jgi:endonuclease-8
MEGPSVFLAAEQLIPFIGKKILSVEGNTTISKDRLLKEKIYSIFSFKKYLFFQFKDFALRTHFMLYGTFAAVVKKITVTGDYPRKERPIRLKLVLSNGNVTMYNCSLKFIDTTNARESCDFSADIMADQWDAKKAYKKIIRHTKEEIADILLNQDIFGGVGNIIKNEVLVQAKILPTRLVKNISQKELKNIINICREYVYKFYAWRQKFELRKHYLIYRQSLCKLCGTKVIRRRTGIYERISFICTKCQK